jgi:hypothetical protein
MLIKGLTYTFDKSPILLIFFSDFGVLSEGGVRRKSKKEEGRRRREGLTVDSLRFTVCGFNAPNVLNAPNVPNVSHAKPQREKQTDHYILSFLCEHGVLSASGCEAAEKHEGRGTIAVLGRGMNVSD